MAKLTFPELTQGIASTYHLAPPSDTALLSQMLKPATPTAANRAPIWYPGAVQILGTGASDTERTLWIRGRAANGAEFSQAPAIALPGNPENPHAPVDSPRDLV